jgi:hypothetical protein
MMVVAGHEGSSKNYLVTWGAAVLLENGKIYNPFTQSRSSMDYLHEMVADGHITCTPRILVPDVELGRATLFVVSLRCVIADTIRPEEGVVVSHRDEKNRYYLFKDISDYKSYAKEYVKSLHSLKREYPNHKAEIRRVGMVMDFQTYLNFDDDPDD